MKRRHFLFGSLAAALPGCGRRPPSRKILVALWDGFGPDYLERSDMPNLKRMAREGASRTGRGVIPSVTNVNNASLVTGSFPRDHGITTNFRYDRACAPPGACCATKAWTWCISQPRTT